MAFTFLLSSRHQCETGIQKYVEIEYDSNSFKKSLEVFFL